MVNIIFCDPKPPKHTFLVARLHDYVPFQQFYLAEWYIVTAFLTVRDSIFPKKSLFFKAKFSQKSVRAIIRTGIVIASMRAIINSACYNMGGFTLVAADLTRLTPDPTGCGVGRLRARGAQGA